MPKRNDLRVIPGGKSGGTETPGGPHLPENCELLLQKADRYMSLAAAKPDRDVTTLISDMIDAIKALGHLELSGDTAAQRRALEYRRLIAELEIEIVAVLESS